MSQFSLCSVTDSAQRVKKFIKTQIFVILPVPLSCWSVPQHCTLLELLPHHVIFFSFSPSLEKFCAFTSAAVMIWKTWLCKWTAFRLLFIVLNHVSHHCLHGRLQRVEVLLMCVWMSSLSDPGLRFCIFEKSHFIFQTCGVIPSFPSPVVGIEFRR